ncbi:MAG: hypothetical protein AB7I18_11240 [Candidatus Berkiella sp.]
MRKLQSVELRVVSGGVVCLYNTDPKHFYVELHSSSDCLMWGYASDTALTFKQHGVFVCRLPMSEWIPLTAANWAQYGIANIDSSPEGNLYSIMLA